MSMIEMQADGLATTLFTRTQRQLLALFFGHPEQSYYLNEVVRCAGVGVGTVQRELERFVAGGLLTVRRIGNQKHYQADPHSPIYSELCGIVRKTFGLIGVLRQALEPFAGQIQAAFVFGSLAKGEETARSDIDLLIVSDSTAYPELLDALAAVEPQLGRPVNPALYATGEFRRKLAESSFLQRILDQPKLFVIGCADDLPQS